MCHKMAEYDYEALSYEKKRFQSRLGKHLDYMHKKIVGCLLNSDGKILLDTGAGTGRITIWLAEKGFEVVGVDISKEMLKKAKGKTQGLSKNIHLVLGDIHFFPFKKGIFDSCLCINVVNHIPEIDRFLKEVKYVIRPRGFFIVNFPNLQSPYFPIAIIVNIRKRALFKKREIQSRWFIPTEISLLMLKAGFKIKEVRGCAIASHLPLGNTLVKVVQRINLSIENSRLKLFAGSLFVKARSSSYITCS